MGFQLPNQLYSGPKLMSNDWIRPTDWPTITNANKEVNFLVNDALSLNIKIQTTFSITAAENLYIDWGDGSGISTITTNTLTATTHTYTAGAGTPCSLGYTTFVIRVWTDSGASITDCRIFSGDTNTSKFTNVPVLEAYYGDNLEIMFASYFSSAGIYINSIKVGSGCVSSYMFLHYVKLPSIFTANMTNLSSAFQNCDNLRKVDLPKSYLGVSIMTLTSTFEGCANLRGLVVPYADFLGQTQTLSGSSICFGAISLRYIYQYDFDGTIKEDLVGFTTLGSGFNLNSSLVSISLDISLMSAAGSVSSVFSNLQSLQRANIIGWLQESRYSAITANMTNMFNNCGQLENVTFSKNASDGILNGAAVNSLNMSGMFANCFSIKGVVTFPRGIYNGTTTTLLNLGTLFSSCTDLIGVDFEQVALSGTTTMTSMFAACTNLNSDFLFLPAPIGSVTAATMFQACPSITKINFRASGVSGAFTGLTAMNLMFTNCFSIKEVTLPLTLASATNVNSMFQLCYALESVIFPASMPAMTNLSAVFQKCISLKTGILPVTIGTTAINGIYNQCYSIVDVVVPAASGTIATAFQDARSIKNLDISMTSTTQTSLLQMCQGMTALETITLPVTMRSVTNAIQLFQGCSNLKNIINFSGFGSTTANVDFSLNQYTTALPGLTFSCRLSKVGLAGMSLTEKSNLSYLRFQNTSTGQWSGTSPHIDISFTNMSTAALVNTFTDIAATGTYTGKFITITGCSGAAGLTSADRLIITSKGWTITG